MDISVWLDTELQKDIFNKKYRFDNETMLQFFDRVSGGNNRIKRLMMEKKMLPAGRILANRGLHKFGKKITYSNCYVNSFCEDNLESIFQCASNIARTFSYGGGIGIDLSKLSPRGAKLNNAAQETTGAVSFMELYSLITGLISQSGRRGALMISLDCHHPDLIEFIDIKSDLDKVTKANISIKITDDFIEAVKNDTDFELSFTREETGEVISKVVRAKEIFRKIAENNWNVAEPGFLMWDNIKKWNLLSEDKNFEYVSTNPCQPLGSKVLSVTGFTKIEDLKQRVVLNGQTYVASELIPTGNKEVFEVELENGICVQMTDNHKILTPNGDIELSQLNVGDKVVMDYTPVFNTGITDEEEYEKGIVAGWFIADGGFAKDKKSYTVDFCIGKDEFDYKDKIESLIQKHISDKFEFKNHHQKPDTCKVGRIHCNEIKEKFKSDILQINTWNKFDISLIGKSKEFKIGFIRSVFTCDGSSRSKSPAMLASINKEFLKMIQTTLIEFGIYSNFCIHNNARSYIAKDGKQRNNKTCYKLTINDANFLKIGYLTDYKQSSVAKLLLKTHHSIEDKKRSLKIKSITSVGNMDVYDINVDNVHHFNSNGMVLHNCGEQPLPAGGSCLLASINLSEFVTNPFTKNAMFDFAEFAECVGESVIFMNEILDEGLPLHPLQEQRDTVRDWLMIGLGIMGLADMLIKLGIRYGSPESIKFCDNIGFAMINFAVSASALLAKEHGPYPMYNKEAVLSSPFLNYNCSKDVIALVEEYGLRNSQLLTCAPTGTLSTMLGISGGIEPIYEISYTRKTESLHGEDKYYQVYTPIAQEYMDTMKTTELPDTFVTAMTLDYRERIKMQAIWQSHIDASISSTINVPKEFTVEQVEDLYLYAHEMKLKGCTIFRDQCKRIGILTQPNAIVQDIVQQTGLARGFIEDVPDNLIYRKYKLKTGCGNMYFFVGVDGNKIYDCFTNTDGVGGCTVNTQANSRLLSTALRGGINIDELVKQLSKSGTCASYQHLRGTQKGALKVKDMIRDLVSEDVLNKIDDFVDTPISNGKSCASALAYILKNIIKEFENEEHEPMKYESYKINLTECSHENMQSTNGCKSCPDCGYSKCD